jgi:DNA replication initiation complex subunit (GINS family)
MRVMPQISEEYLSNTLRLELRSKDLTEVGDDFYKDVRTYISNLKEKIESETLKKNFKAVSKLSSELETAEDNFRRIVEIRASKILKARAENYKMSIEGKMTPEEKIFYESISSIFKNHMESLITGNIIINEVKPLQTSNPTQNKEATDEVNTEKLKVVYVYKDTPTLFLDGKSIKLNREDILTIPEKHAKILEAQGLVKIIK